ncbi:hypothetical protein Belba_2308 [Belliella baltica DSM 15883]|uniref:DUF488 domain-containing protein n=1 Tax=Belliella baltica (strain DSM 15883 / CIP 108006 / LMG 21964 / BA134) TaxID=866536 RepID=I3Z6K4_BELBD|nr:DUF488 domain-containing protein [Belliella baltica]AFL84872.1 hypothetical protein Belba_2308 [Belliella baltica DSM 15883]
MMYNRRKILLAILEAFGGELEKLQLQKLLMIFSSYQEERNYHFVPYKFGCFSFQANADLSTMRKYEQVLESEKTWKKIDSIDYGQKLKPKDRLANTKLKTLFQGKKSEDLIRYTYTKFPYYAINSTVSGRYLNDLEKAIVEAEKPKSNKKALFTIGYEGLSLEQYINKLLAEDVKVLCDVRKNSFSMKYGFNKSQLTMACQGVGIRFIHIPEVGIVSDKRQELNNQSDYDALFEDYKETVLPQTRTQQQEILDLIKNFDRVAITCFEADICQCHRKHLAEAICELPDFEYELLHI